jgi:hypothetical protein
MKKVLMCCLGAFSAFSVCDAALADDTVLHFKMPDFYGAKEYASRSTAKEQAFTQGWLDSSHAWSIAPFNYLCISSSCVEQKIRKDVSLAPSEKHAYFAKPYPDIMWISPKEAVRELGYWTYWTPPQTSYIHAFLPSSYILDFNERKYRAFNLSDGEYVYRTVSLRIDRFVPDGLAICRSRKPIKSPKRSVETLRVPHDCSVVAIFGEHERLYRVLIAKRNPTTNEYGADKDPIFSEFHPPNELDLMSSTPSWNGPPVTSLSLSKTCLKPFARELFSRLAENKGILLPREVFELSISAQEDEVRISGDIPRRVSLVDSAFWETIGLDITIRKTQGTSYVPKVRIYGYVGTQRETREEPDESFYDTYFQRIVASINEARAKVC